MRNFKFLISIAVVVFCTTPILCDVGEEEESSMESLDYSGASTSYAETEEDKVNKVSTLTDYDASSDDVYFEVTTPKLTTISEQPMPPLTNPSADVLVDKYFLDLCLPILIGLLSLLILVIVIAIVFKRILKSKKYDVSQIGELKLFKVQEVVKLPCFDLLIPEHLEIKPQDGLICTYRY